MKFTKTLASVAAAALAVSSLAVSAFADTSIPADGANFIVDVASILPAGADIADVYGARIVFSDAAAEVVAAGAGGGFIFSTASNNWNQKQWCNGCGEDETHDIQWDPETKSVTRMETAPFFTAEDISGEEGTYGQIALCQWWPKSADLDFTLELLDKDGNVIEAAPEEPIAEIGYTDGATPSYSYTVTGNSEAIKVAVAVAPALLDGVDPDWNDWCGEGVSVTYPDGTIKYYQFGGAQVTWEWGTEDEDGNKTVYSADGVNGETWVGTVSAEGGELTIPVVEGAVVDFYCLSWDSYAGTQLLFTDITEVPAEVAPGETTEPEDPQPEDPQPEDPQPVEPGETEDPSDILPGESSGKPVSPDTGVAVTVIPAALAAAALATTGIVLKKRSK